MKDRLRIAEILEHEIEITRKYEELVLRGARVLGSIILKVCEISQPFRFKQRLLEYFHYPGS
ncbi:MAG: hypothetical protein DRJ60_06330 [Thermoprotei archaeon]|nr:MAG: hypothetical protein DRJ60_06330 [Thermoprotei archaeon]